MTEQYIDVSNCKITVESGEAKLYASMEQLAEAHQLAAAKTGRQAICVEVLEWLIGYGRKEATAAIKKALDSNFTDDEIKQICEELLD